MAARRWAAWLLLVMALTGCSVEPSLTLTAAPSPQTTPAPESLSFQGHTFAFEYPRSWHLWSQSYGGGQETVVIANVPPEMLGRGGLLPGTIKVDLYSTGDLKLSLEPPPEGAQLLTFAPSTIKFFLWRASEVPWIIGGAVRTSDRVYRIGVFMATEQPELGAVGGILASWRPLTP